MSNYFILYTFCGISVTEIDLQLRVRDIICLALTLNVKQLYEQMVDSHISLVSEILFHLLECG